MGASSLGPPTGRKPNEPGGVSRHIYTPTCDTKTPGGATLEGSRATARQVACCKRGVNWGPDTEAGGHRGGNPDLRLGRCAGVGKEDRWLRRRYCGDPYRRKSRTPIVMGVR